MTGPGRRQERPILINAGEKHRYGTRGNYEKDYNKENHAVLPRCSREPYTDPPREDLVDTTRFDHMMERHGYISQFERLAWTEQQARKFAFRLMKYGKDFRNIAWEEKNLSACVRFYYTGKHTGWFRKIVEDVKAAEMLLLHSRPFSHCHPIDKCFPNKPLITHSPVRMRVQDVAAFFLLHRDSLTTPDLMCHVIGDAIPRDLQADWAPLPTSSSSHVAGHESAAGNCPQFDVEDAVAGLATTQRRLAIQHATAALGMGERQVISVLEKAAQLLVTGSTRQQPEDDSLVLLTALELLIKMATYSKGAGQEQTAEEHMEAAEVVSDAIVKIARQLQAFCPSEWPVTADEVQSHPTPQAEDRRKRDDVAKDTILPQCMSQQQVSRQQATTTQMRCHPISEEESTSQQKSAHRDQSIAQEMSSQAAHKAENTGKQTDSCKARTGRKRPRAVTTSAGMEDSSYQPTAKQLRTGRVARPPQRMDL